MLSTTARFYNPDGPQRVAVVSVEPGPRPGEYFAMCAGSSFVPSIASA